MSSVIDTKEIPDTSGISLGELFEFTGLHTSSSGTSAAFLRVLGNLGDAPDLVIGGFDSSIPFDDSTEPLEAEVSQTSTPRLDIRGVSVHELVGRTRVRPLALSGRETILHESAADLPEGLTVTPVETGSTLNGDAGTPDLQETTSSRDGGGWTF